MRLFVLAGLLQAALSAQQCAPPEALRPVATTSGALDANSCRLADGSVYTEYLLELPVRGALEIDAPSGDEITLHLRDTSGVRIERGASIRRALEAGRYSVLVSAPSAGEYSLRTNFTAATGALCGSFPAVPLNGKVSAKLGPSSCTTPGGAPYDGWTLRTLGPGTLDAAATSDELAPTLVLRSDDGHALAEGAALSYPLEADRQYTLAVFGDKPGTYGLSLAFRPPEDDPCRAKKTLSESESLTGTIDARSCTYALNNLGDQAPYDFYDVRVTEGGMAEFNVSGTSFDPTVWLLDAAGNLAASDTLSAGPHRSLLRIPLRAGAYTLMVLSAQPAGGAYTLQYNWSPGPAKVCAPRELTPGAPAAASLSTDNCRSPFGLADAYRVTLPAAGTLELGLTSDVFDPLLALRDEKDDVIVFNDNVDGLTDSYLAADLPAGTYAVLAASNLGTGAYNLQSRFTAHAVTPCTSATTLEPNHGIVRYLGQSRCTNRNGQPEELYEFTLPESGLVAANLIAPQFDGFLTLTVGDGAILRTDDNSYGNGDSLIVQYLPAGTYRLGVRAAQTSDGGAFQLSLLFAAGPPPPGCTPAATLEPGAAVSGNILFTGCQLPNDFADVYRFTLSEKSTVDLKMSSQVFDAYVSVLDARGSVVAEDDDSGGGADARILATLPAGDYFVIASPLSYNPYDSGGAYSLAFNSTAAPPDASADAARVDYSRNDQNHEVHAFDRLPGVHQPGIGQSRQRQKDKAQQRNHKSVVSPLQVIRQEKQ